MDAYVGVGSQVLANAANTAVFQKHPSPQFVISFLQPFGLAGWQVGSADFSWKSGSKAGFRINGLFEKFERYRRLFLSGGYAMSLSNKTQIGLLTSVERRGLAGYESTLAIGYRLGVCYLLSPRVTLGVELGFLSLSHLAGFNGPRPPNLFRTELIYQLSEQLLLYSSGSKAPGSAAEFQLALRYQPVQRCVFRAGVFPTLSGFAIGAGLQWRDFRFELALGYHSFFGLVALEYAGFSKAEFFDFGKGIKHYS